MDCNADDGSAFMLVVELRRVGSGGLDCGAFVLVIGVCLNTKVVFVFDVI